MEKDANQLNCNLNNFEYCVGFDLTFFMFKVEIARSFIDNSLKTLESLPKNYEFQVQKLNAHTKELGELEKELVSLNDCTKIGLYCDLL